MYKNKIRKEQRNFQKGNIFLYIKGGKTIPVTGSGSP
jgi:hypothetical protein